MTKGDTSIRFVGQEVRPVVKPSQSVQMAFIAVQISEPVTGVRYNSLLWMYTLNTLTWPELNIALKFMMLLVSPDRSFMMDPLSYFLFQPVLYDWCNKGCGMCYPVYGAVHIKDPLLLIIKSSPCGGSGFPFSLSVRSFTICMRPHKHK